MLEIKGEKIQKGGSVERRTQNLHTNFPKALTDSETVHVRRKLSETQKKTTGRLKDLSNNIKTCCPRQWSQRLKVQILHTRGAW